MGSGGSPAEGSKGGVAERLREFRRALTRYGPSIEHRIPRGLALKIEEAEQVIIESLRGRASLYVRDGRGLDEFMDDLKASGEVDRLIVEVAERIGVNVEDPRAARDALEAGDYASKQAMAAFIVYQAVARAYAEAYRDQLGTVDKGDAQCPVCGATSDLAIVRDDGVYMSCPFCYYEWRLGDDIRCPYCGNEDRLSIGLFMDRQRRVALAHCQQCGSTWKVVLAPDLGSLVRPVLHLVAHGVERFKVYTAPPGDGLTEKDAG